MGSFSFRNFCVLFVIFIGCLCAIPNLFTDHKLERFPSWLPHKKISLGLDLQGGSQILLEANLDEALHERLLNLQDEVRTLLLKHQTRYKNLRILPRSTENAVGALQFEFRDSSDINKTVKAVQAIPGVRVETTSMLTTIFFTAEEMTRVRDSIMGRSVEIVSRRVNELGTKEPSIQRQGRNRILVQMPGVDNPARVKDILGKTAKLTFHLVQGPATSHVAPPGTIIASSHEDGRVAESLFLDKRPLMTGENLEDARPGVDEYNQPRIDFSLDASGARKFGEITRKNVGRRFAMVLDGKILMAPNIKSPILGGRATIDGRFSFKEAYDSSLLMRSGALPAPLTPIEERSVGPDLGADSILAGQRATIVAVGVIAVSMLVIYSLFGLFANIALLANMILLIGALSCIGATLTLSGIAGIALTLGMAVDANVLIFERIKEEIRKGTEKTRAIDLGFKQAMATILDSNITTLIGGFLLFSYGSGLLRGFAVTLSLGIIISMFTAISFTRLIVSYYMRWSQSKDLPL